MGTFRILSLLLFTVVSFGLPAAEGERMAKQFLETHCIRCHGEEKQKGKLALHDVSFDFTQASNSELWLDILAQLTAGDMPPPDEGKRPDDSDRNGMIEWIDRQLLTAGSGDAYRKKLLAPEYGNWVNHQKLFSGEIKTPSFSPARLWRFNSEIFSHKGFGNAKSPFSYVTSERGVRDYAAMSVADQSTVQMMMIVADSFLVAREKRGEFKELTDVGKELNDSDLTELVRREHMRVIGRYPVQEEQEKYLTFLKQNIETGGHLDGFKTTVKAMFLSPESIYRMEFGLGKVDTHGRRHLSPNELAHAVAYA